MKKQVKIILLNEVFCSFIGLNKDHIDMFYHDYAVFAANYRFSPKFKLGQWDGRISFFQKTAKSYSKLLDEIIPKLVSLGYQIAIEDRRIGILSTPPLVSDNLFSDYVNPETDTPWVLRNYQIDFVNTLISCGGGVGLAGTGGGKSIMSAAIAKLYELDKNLKTIVIVPDKNLIVQTKKKFLQFGLDVGEYSGTTKNLDHQHIISTWQALQNNPEIMLLFQVVIVDECHGAKAKVITTLLNEYGKNIPYRFGVTGTLPKDPSEQLTIKVSLGPVQCSIPSYVLIEQKVLADLHINIIQHDIDMKEQYVDFLTEKPFPIPSYIQFKEQYFAEYGPEKTFLHGLSERLNWVALFLDELRNNKKGNTLCLVNGIKVGKKLAKLIPNSQFLYGKDEMEDRQIAFNSFSNNDNVLLIANMQIASTGLDIPRIFNLVCLDPGKSFVKAIQSIGRGLRMAHDKDFLNMYDICTDFKYSKKHLRERIKYYKEAKYQFSKKTITYKRDPNVTI